MSIIDLAVFKSYLRELSNDLDATLQLALDAAEAEAGQFIGQPLAVAFPSPAALPSDLAMPVLLLGRAHADDGDAERYRGIAQRLAQPYRQESGVRAA